jgi:hypothetical protein
MNKPMLWSLLVLGSTFACAAKNNGGAGAPNPDTADAEDGSDTNAAESDTESIGQSFVGSASGGGLTLASAGELTMGDLSAANVGDAAKAFYQPAGCLAVTSDSAAKTVTYQFSDCTGPFGMVHITGTVNAGWSAPSTTELDLSFTATSLEVNRATIDWSATAKIAASGSARTMQWDGQFSGTTARGRSFSRQNHKTIAWTTGTSPVCAQANGYSEGDVTGRKLRTDVTNWKRCKGACPESGDIKITNEATNKSIDIKFDGGDQITFTGPNGGQLTVTLACGL